MIVVRLFINMYQKQTLDVKWKGKYSKEFSMGNGTKQGAVLSPILFCFYMNDLFKELRKNRSGCFGYADDMLLLCPSRSGLQEMLNISEKYANEHSINFSSDINPNKSKTKGMIFSKHETDLRKYKPVVLCENHLPWVSASKYLGHRITDRINGLNEDIMQKRAKYIERNCELLQEFPFSHPEFKCKINQIYNTSFTSSVLWDFTSQNTQMIINTWSRSVRHMWDLPLQTHRYFIEPLGGTHLQTMLYTRFTKFIQSISNGMKKSSNISASLD